MWIVVALTVTLALGGCTTRLVGVTWTKPDASMQQMTADDTQCLRQAADRRRAGESYVGGVVDLARLVHEQRVRDRAYVGCMTMRGYTRAS